MSRRFRPTLGAVAFALFVNVPGGLLGLITVVGLLPGRMSDKVGPRWRVATGLTLVSLSLVLFLRLDEQAGFSNILPGLLVGGVGRRGGRDSLSPRRQSRRLVLHARVENRSRDRGCVGCSRPCDHGSVP